MRPVGPAPGVPPQAHHFWSARDTPLPASYDETTRTPPPASRLPAERRARVAAPPIRKEIGGIHPSILPPGPRPGQVPVLPGCGTHVRRGRELWPAEPVAAAP